MQYTASLFATALLAVSVTASPAFYSADSAGKLTRLEARNSYGLGVNLFNQANCVGNIAAVRNHDVNSCESASRAGSSDTWTSAIDKTDGKDRGVGCMSTFTDTACQSGSQVYSLGGNGACINFPSTVRCVVVAERGSGGVCNLNQPTC